VGHVSNDFPMALVKHVKQREYQPPVADTKSTQRPAGGANHVDVLVAQKAESAATN
jgi:hypothetical protein